MRRWALDQLTVLGVRPAEFVDIAAYAGFDAISPFLGLGGSGGLPTVPLRAGDPETVAMGGRLKDTGVRLNQVDGFVISEDFDPRGIRAGLELVAEMGANNAVTLIFDGDEIRAYEHLDSLCEMAEEVGIGVVLEFTALSQVPSLAAALGLVEKIGGDRLALLVDLLHLAQAGETPADMAALPAGMIRGAQLCDGPAGLDMERYTRVALEERMVPGTGELPVADFLAAVPDSVIVGLEVPLKEPRDLRERAKLVRDSVRALDQS